MLRHHGCTLPIQAWHLGPEEMDDEMRQLFNDIDVETVDAREIRKAIPTRILNGWEAKPYAVANCPFEEVIFFDADTCPCKDPTYLFDSEQFNRYGAIFWPDRGALEASSYLWTFMSKFGVPQRSEPAHESSCMVIDKLRCWVPLSITRCLNDYSHELVYHWVHGDKDTFKGGWLMAEQDWVFAPPLKDPGHWAMYQHCPVDGQRLYEHRSMTSKWNLDTEQIKLNSTIMHDLGIEIIEDLKTKWSYYREHQGSTVGETGSAPA
jgi:hypothetical protein